MVNNAKYEVYFNLRFDLNNGTQIEEELTKEAVLDSKKKAEEMAELLNMKEVGVARFNLSSDDRYYDYDEDDEDDYCKEVTIINRCCAKASSCTRRNWHELEM